MPHIGLSVCPVKFILIYLGKLANTQTDEPLIHKHVCSTLLYIESALDPKLSLTLYPNLLRLISLFLIDLSSQVVCLFTYENCNWRTERSNMYLDYPPNHLHILCNNYDLAIMGCSISS